MPVDNTLAVETLSLKMRLSNIGARTLKQSDAVLAIGVLGMIGLMILPLPPWLLDYFLTLNLAWGAVLLMVSVLTPAGPKVFTFPTLIILSTLFRLALDVSSTRLILSQADAGEVIRSFGQFAAKGSVVVGLVVFLVITMVQLLVISKGAESTANATANFVKDSIGGRQMALTADERNKKPDEIAKLRDEMNVEVDFYGRMYGAINFVKGDAIAALVIAGINIVGGLIVGLAVNHMRLSDAVETYTLLTVGAGLVSQIPALVGSVAATILISRVTSNQFESGLGEAAAKQFIAYPVAMMLAAVMLAVMGLVPGMPTFPFLLLGSALGVGGYQLKKAAGRGKATLVTKLQDVAAPLLQLRVSTSVAEGECNLALQSATDLIMSWGKESGIPLDRPNLDRTASSIPYKFLRRAVPIAEGGTWLDLKQRLELDLKLNPEKYFNSSESLRWFQAAESNCGAVLRQNERLFSAPFAQDGLRRFLKRLVSQRFPINDLVTIIETLVSASKDLMVSNEDAHEQLVALVRKELKFGAAGFYREHYLVANKSKWRHKLDVPANWNDYIKTEFQNADAVSVLVTISGERERAWKSAEILFDSKEIPFPLLVVSTEELVDGIREKDMVWKSR